MAALVKPRNARRLFQNTAAVFGFGIDQLCNLPLAYKRRRMRPGRGVGKQHLYIARTNILCIDLISRARVPGNAPCDFDLVGIIKARRGYSVIIINEQHHFGKAARRAR